MDVEHVKNSRYYFNIQEQCFKDDLVDHVRDLCHIMGVVSVLDFSLGGSRLAASLDRLGISARSYGFMAWDNGRHIDLSKASPTTLDGARAGHDGPWLTTCFNALEYVGQDEVGSALHCLNVSTCENLLVTISHRPSPDFNRYQATVLPPQVWIRLFEDAGFQRIDYTAPESIARHSQDLPRDPLLDHWHALNPFRLESPSNSSAFLFKKIRSLPARSNFLSAWRDRHPWLSDQNWRPRCPAQESGTIVFPIMHMQDFNISYPLASVAAKNSVIFVLGHDFIDPNQLNLKTIEGFLLARGYQVIYNQPPADVVPGLPPDSVVVSASESTGSTAHVIASGFVAQARARGLGTLHLQHGILVPDGQWSPYELASQRVLAWSDDFAAALAELGCRSPPPIDVAGCPKFDPAGYPAPWPMVFGEWVKQWPKRCIVAANTSWVAHGRSMPELDEDLLEIAVRHPEWLFLLKSHPGRPDLLPAPETLPRNVFGLTDPALLVMARPLQSLLRTADTLVATQSTSLLDAAVCGIPSVLLDSKHPRPYRYLTAKSGPDIALPESASISSEFRDHYLSPATVGRASANAHAAIRQVRADAAPEPHFLGWAALARRLGEFSTGRIEKPVPNALPPATLPFPFAVAGEAKPVWRNKGVIQLDNGNIWCRAQPNGFTLCPNRPGDPVPVLRYYGLDLTRFSALFMTAWVDKRCPGTVFNITTLIGDDVIDSYTYRFGPSGRQRIRVPLEKAGLDGLSLTVRLDDGVKSANSSGLRLGSIALVAKPHT